MILPPDVDRVPRYLPHGEEGVALRTLLDRLGETADEVAATLEREGCKGPPQNDCFCPVARYLSHHSREAASATATVCALGEFVHGEDDGVIVVFQGREWARTPEPVAEVIRGYDRGGYAFLAP